MQHAALEAKDETHGNPMRTPFRTTDGKFGMEADQFGATTNPKQLGQFGPRIVTTKPQNAVQTECKAVKMPSGTDLGAL